MVEPVSILAQFALEPFRKLSQVIDEFAVQVLNTPLHLALVLRIRRMSKMSFNMMLIAPGLPSLFELRSMIRKNSLRKLFLFF
jgi:hypothetical protein